MSDIESVKSVDIAPGKNDKKCAPAMKFQDGSCMPLDVLIELAGAFNHAIENGEIKNAPIHLSERMDALNPSKYKRHLVHNFKDRLDSVCDEQQCWIKQSFTKNINKAMKKFVEKDVWRPRGPQGQFDWLNTIHINQVMLQHEKVHPEFKFFGAIPIDFDDIDSDLSNIDFESFQKGGKSKVGVIFNLDEHWKSGSHWVASYADLKDGSVYFFDSYGERPDARIRKYMRRVAKHIENGGKRADVKYNHLRHQYKNSECGVYSINFIERMLSGDSFKTIITDKTSDNDINKFRQEYFIIPDKK